MTPAKPAARGTRTGAAKQRSAGRAGAVRKPRAERPSAPAPSVEIAADNERLEERAARNTLAVNPLIGLSAADIGSAAKTFADTVARQPLRAARYFGAYAQELWRVTRGESALAPDPKDRRFADVAWQSSSLHKGLLKVYMAATQELNRFIDSSELSARDKERVRVVASIYLDAISPSNTLLNPSAMKRMVDTGGKSLVDGVRNMVHDLRFNNGLPSQVDKSAFEIGAQPVPVARAPWCSRTRCWS